MNIHRNHVRRLRVRLQPVRPASPRRVDLVRVRPVAKDQQLVFEREWRIPQDTDSQRLLDDVLGFLLDALTIALSEDMPPARRELVYTTSEAIRELAAA